MHRNKQTTHEKQNLSKTEQFVVICWARLLPELQKFQTKLVNLRNLSTNQQQKESTTKHAPVKSHDYFSER